MDFRRRASISRSKFGGLDVSDATRLESANAKPKKLLAESMFENEVIKEAVRRE